MKTKTLRESAVVNDDALPSYDLTRMKAVRGKYHKALQHGYTIRVHQTDGTVTEEFVNPDEDVIWLEADVRAYFPTSQAVNTALRALITVIEQTPIKAKTSAKRRMKSVSA